tara:strand:+ start:5705 stop:6457 length:753 start_codon:yes stop_codon:yes gene_type:complete
MNLKDLFTKPDAVSITKNTAQDKVSLLRDAIEHVFEVKGYQEWAYYEDHDESYIYFTLWYEPKEKYSQFKIAYTYNEHVVRLIEDEASFVTKLTEWKDVPSEESDVEKSVLKVLKSFFSKETPAEIIKAFDDEQMISVEPIWRPAGEVDLHGDTISLEEIRKAVDNINMKIDKGTLQAGLFHGHKTNTFTWQRAWVQEVDATLEDTFVKAGTPLISAKWSNEEAWEDKKAGVLGAPSFGAKGIKVEMEDE